MDSSAPDHYGEGFRHGPSSRVLLSRGRRRAGASTSPDQSTRYNAPHHPSRDGTRDELSTSAPRRNRSRRGCTHVKKNFRFIYITGEQIVHVPLPDTMRRTPIRPDARSTGHYCPQHPTARRMLPQIMCPCTPFSRAKAPQRARPLVTMLWSGLLVITIPRCPQTQREPATVTRGHPRLHRVTPPHLRKAHALRYRGRLQGRPSMSQTQAPSTPPIIHKVRNIRALHRM